MTDLDAPVVRRTEVLRQNRRIVATLTKDGVELRLERTGQKVRATYSNLWRWMEQSTVTIPPRRR